MAKRESEPIVRKHLFLFDGDWERLEAIFGGTIGVAKAIRTIIRRTLDNIDNRVNKELSKQNGNTIIGSRLEIIRDSNEYEPESSDR